MEDEYESARERMVEFQIRNRGIQDARVLRAMSRIPRHLFLADELKAYAYADEPLPIGEGQTISQPYIVAYMTEVLKLLGNEKVLEIGTGSGYQTAVLAELARDVYTVELISRLSIRAQEKLRAMGYQNVHFKVGDGSEGWPDFAPFDAIIVTAAPSSVPRSLESQLGVPGRMVIPVGSEFQELILVTRKKRGFKRQRLLSVRFVPLVTVQ
ncbi:MAG: protein-L-isoaspartate(D-aspartate) O-methyltransferase [Acidobacteriota bacterium]|nr:protein-L-isoaspartate(D-aspartate) O-methyltransferase [Acidobacteriota bacterium]